MKKLPYTLLALAATLLLSLAFAQVDLVEVLGVDATVPHSDEAAASVADDSVGEVRINVRAVDANGDPVEGATVTWRIENATGNPVQAVDSNAMTAEDEAVSASEGEPVEIEGGTTDENGEAFLVVDSATVGDATVHVVIDGVEGFTYSGGPMRVVWF